MSDPQQPAPDGSAPKSTNAPSAPSVKARLLYLAPLLAFVAMTLFLARGLFMGDPHVIPSVLIGKPVPAFSVATLVPNGGSSASLDTFSEADLKTGDVVILNFWASWCAPCHEEHPVLMQMATEASKEQFRLYAINYKDQEPAAQKFLQRLGNPFEHIGRDDRGRVGIDFGLSGVPETYVINGQGEIVYKHIGPLSAEIWKEKLRPIVRAAVAGNTE